MYILKNEDKIRHATVLAVVFCGILLEDLQSVANWWHQPLLNGAPQFANIMLTDYSIMMFSIPTSWVVFLKLQQMASGMFTVIMSDHLFLPLASPSYHLIFISVLCIYSDILFCLALPAAVYVPYSKIVFTDYIYHSRHTMENTYTSLIL